MDANYNEVNTDLKYESVGGKVFNLGTKHGGKHYVVAQKPINDTDFYVLAYDLPLEKTNNVSPINKLNLFDKINQTLNLKNNKDVAEQQVNDADCKLRFFKFTLNPESLKANAQRKYSWQECEDANSVTEAVNAFLGKDFPTEQPASQMKPELEPLEPGFETGTENTAPEIEPLTPEPETPEIENTPTEPTL